MLSQYARVWTSSPRSIALRRASNCQMRTDGDESSMRAARNWACFVDAVVVLSPRVLFRDREDGIPSRIAECLLSRTLLGAGVIMAQFEDCPRVGRR